jgi:hypothetical protein
MKAVFLCGVSLFVIGCGSSNPANPTSASTPTGPSTVPKPAYTLSGTVRDDAAAPLQGASVYIGLDPRRPGTGGGQTDAQGQYVISGLAGGTQPYGVSKPGYVRISGTVSIGQELVKDFTLRPGVSVGGQTSELGVGPLGGVTITVTSGPNTGVQTTSTSWGVYGLGPIAPGDLTLRASKPGYDSVERTVHATVNEYAIDFVLRWAYGTCLTSVSPVLFDRFPSAGGTATVAVVATRDRSWTAESDNAWIEVTSGAASTGSGTVLLRVLPYPVGAVESRSGAVMVRCSAAEGQNVWVNQLPNCQTSLQWAPGSPQLCPAAGGTGRILVHNAAGGCRSQDVSESEWIRLVGAGSYMTREVNFIVAPNTTHAARTGVIVVGETRWEIVQQS